jgi:hypothetical protein
MENNRRIISRMNQSKNAGNKNIRSMNVWNKTLWQSGWLKERPRSIVAVLIKGLD